MQNPEANIVMENHEFGLPPAHYEQWPVLSETFDILTTTLDRKGVEYVSTIEHKRFPFFGTQVIGAFIAAQSFWKHSVQTVQVALHARVKAG